MECEFEKTSNVAIVVVEEKVTRTAINNYEAHIKQMVLSGNAQENYKKYNYSFRTDFTGKKYRDVINEHLKKGSKFDKSTLSEKDFWVGRTYKKSSGKTTTYVESMTIAPPFKIHPDQLEDFINSYENCYFTDIVDFLKQDERFKDCLFLDFIVHMDEVYVPESITLPDGTEKLLSEDERWEHAYIKPHMHIAYIPTVKAHDEKTGKDYLKLSRKDVWYSDKGYKHSYSEFIDRKFEMVDKRYGFVRGELYEEMPENEKPVHIGLEEWKRKNDQARIDRLIEQQVKENENWLNILSEEAESIEAQKRINREADEALKTGFEEMINDMVMDFEGDYQKIDYVLLKAERKMFLDMLNTIKKLIEPLKDKGTLFARLYSVIETVTNKITANNLIRNSYKGKTDKNMNENFDR